MVDVRDAKQTVQQQALSNLVRSSSGSPRYVVLLGAQVPIHRTDDLILRTRRPD